MYVLQPGIFSLLYAFETGWYLAKESEDKCFRHYLCSVGALVSWLAFWSLSDPIFVSSTSERS